MYGAGARRAERYSLLRDGPAGTGHILEEPSGYISRDTEVDAAEIRARRGAHNEDGGQRRPPD
jgi:hypothetical protein